MSGPLRRLSARIERWPIAGSFVIARGAKTEAVVIVAEIEEADAAGRGECVPYARYGETPETVMATIMAQADAVAQGAGRDDLLRLMPAGAARNAIDCALWDLEAKRTRCRVWELAGLPAPRPVKTCYTLSLGPPQAMAEAARKAAHRPILKIKLGGEGDRERIVAVRAAAPQATLVVDANESWTPENLERNLAACADAEVALIEQPLPAGADEALEGLEGNAPICADESVHDRASLDALGSRYDAINVKLDKTGGLTEALALMREAEARGLAVMVGCMVGTSLAMAPGVVAAQRAALADLDGPLLLAQDRKPGLFYENGLVGPPEADLWG